MSSQEDKVQRPTWVLPPSCEKRLITLLICLNLENTAPDLMFVLPAIANRYSVSFSEEHSWLKNGMRIKDLSAFCRAVQEIQRRGTRPLLCGRKPKGWMSEDSHAAMVAALRAIARWILYSSSAGEPFSTGQHHQSCFVLVHAPKSGMARISCSIAHLRLAASQCPDLDDSACR